MKLNILNKQRKILETKITQKQATSDDLIDIFVFSQNYDGVQAVNENKEYVEDEDREFKKNNEDFEEAENGEEENKNDED